MDSEESESQVQAKLAKLVHTDIWFADGNIVIVTGTVAFKVHRGQLERHSEFFHDLFSIPQPENLQLVDGCQWVELFDSPFDVFYLLLALYDGLYFKKPYGNDFPAIAAVLRLSTKYLIDHLRLRCISRLERDWPSALAGWDNRERAATDNLGRYSPRETCAHPISVIALALELDLQSILPAAFYDLCRYGPSKIVCGTHSPPHPVLLSSTRNAGRSSVISLRLSHDLLCRTLLGRESAQRFIASFIDQELKVRSISPECSNKDDDDGRLCRESFYFIMLNILRSVGGIAVGRDGDPLYTLVQAGEMLSRTDFSDGEKQCGLKMCQPCKVDFYTSVKKAREEVWVQIPRWFGLNAHDTVNMVDVSVD